MRDKTTAALLAFFLGGFGGQFFYLGRIGAGIMCILFFWTLIPYFIALYHTIKFLAMSQEAFNLEYNKDYVQTLNSAQMAASMKQINQQLASAAPVQPAFHMQAAPQPVNRAESSPAHTAKPAVSITDELERLFQLKEKGALTEEEYLVRKAKLLA